MNPAPTNWREQYAETLDFLRDFWLSDRPPSRPALTLHQYTAAENGAPPDPDPLRARAQADLEAQLRRRVLNGDDYVPYLSTGAGTGAVASAFGSQVQDSGGGHWAHALLPDLAAAAALEKPPVTAGQIGGEIAYTRLLAEVSDLPVRLLDVQSPVTVATQLLGVSELFMAMYDEPARVHRLLELITEFTVDIAEAQRALLGERFVPYFWPHGWAPPEVGVAVADDYILTLSPELYERFSLPCLRRLAEHFGGLFLHTCNLYPQHLPLFQKIPHLRGVNCDLSMSAPLRQILDALPGVVVAPHVYMNKEITRPSQAAWLEEMLGVWRPGDRLWPVVLAVIYDDSFQGDQPTDWQECARVWRNSGWELKPRPPRHGAADL